MTAEIDVWLVCWVYCHNLDTVARLHDDYFTDSGSKSTRWQNPYHWYFDFIFGQWEEIEMHHSSVYIQLLVTNTTSQYLWFVSYSPGSVVVNSTLQFKNASSVPETSAVANVLVEAANNNSNFSLPVNTSSIVVTSKLLLTLHNTAFDLLCNFPTCTVQFSEHSM